MSGKKRRKFCARRAASGLRRKAHFESGGSPSEWRGVHTVALDKKKHRSKTLCRRPLQEEE